MRRREFLLALAAAGLAPAPWLRAQGTARTPADAWPQFRGTPSLTGVSATTIPQQPKLAWTWEGGEAFDSSAAIVDGVVYIGSATGELLAIGLADGKLRWRYKAGESIGESSPAVAGGRVFIGDLDGVAHAVNVADGKAAWTFKTRSEIKSSPVVVGETVLIGSYDGSLYALNIADGKPRWSFATENYVHGVPCVVNGVAHFAGCDEVFHAVRISDGKEAFQTSATAYTGASVCIVDNVAYYGTFDNQVIALDLGKKAVKWRYEHPDRKFPFYSSAAVIDGTMVLGGRDRMVHALDVATGKGEVDLHDARPHRLVTGHRRRPRLRRVQRRPDLRPGSLERESGVGARGRRRADQLAGTRLRPHRHRLHRRKGDLLRLRCELAESGDLEM